ncbi:GDNF-inducible zinc finger protein 1 isoform X2 [Nasonia vitripennis]|uniref:Uncharacterized protein n=1 Tax=Nasonia vitripennis TaxID=7425 RepID=A0A7M7TEB4_NASVI|nr:GDNF-inducible zinc finger protein 1 isoform X2 [Nasonia vitripennis]XP_032457253.1 GDNF-inducible zinc finger protein 1 isoform X2 [Nasonia vitripennis]
MVRLGSDSRRILCTPAVLVHKLVITTCTDYFLQLEREQIGFDSTKKNMIIMPPDMPYECVKSIISFMYTGQLEYWTSEQNALYYTAQKMKMSVLTKLLDAQSDINISKQKADDLTLEQAIYVTSKEQTYINNELPLRNTPNIEEKKFAKRKIIENIDFTTSNNNFELHSINDGRKDLLQNTEGPSRFDLPEIEDMTLGVFSSFDDITYNTKPIVQAPEKVVINYKENLASISDNIANMVVKIDSNLSYVEVENEDMLSSEDDWIHLQPNVKKEQREKSPLKKLRFDFEEKENFQKSETNHIISSNAETVDSVDNHAKIIREVLKNYPHLVQHNKNIRLKIMQKDSKNNECSSGKTKVSYVVLKSDSLMVNNANSKSFKDFNDSWFENNENGPWKCSKCNLNEQYNVYCMYRSHMQDVHGEKFDPRICEHCGYKATKRNILMYHMYTKHNVPPPKSMSFPKCHLCPYIALSESLLTRHLNNHKHEHSKIISSLSKQQMICYECEQSFPDTTTLINHEIITGHKNPEKSIEQMYLCLHCGKRMANAFTLQVHEECYHKHAFPLSFLQSASIISDKLPEIKEIGAAFNNATSSLCENNTQRIINKNHQKQLENESSVSSIANLENKQKTYETITNNERFQRQMPTPLTVCLNGENGHKGMQSFSYRNYQHSQQNDEIVEEVVEELETVDIEKCKEAFCKDQKDTRIKNIYKNVKDDLDDQKNCLFNSENTYSNYSEMNEIVSYVEEETEILEYETINNI